MEIYLLFAVILSNLFLLSLFYLYMMRKPKKKIVRISSTLQISKPPEDHEIFSNEVELSTNSLVRNIHTSNECFQCNAKLNFDKQEYFAYDNQYCKSCWSRINYNIVKNHI